MAAEHSYAKLGLFVVVGVLVMLLTGAFFIQRLRSREVIPLVTYFNENVSGLDVSSPVRFRGVSVGRVSEVRIHPDGDIIEVDFELFKDRLSTLGENVKRLEQAADLPMTRRLRARVVGNPVTGEGYLLLDIPKNPPPPPVLGFTPERGYVPSMPSPMDAVGARLPELLERAQETFETLTKIVERVPDSLDRSDKFFTSVEAILRDSDLPKLSAELRAFSTSTSGQIAQMSANMERIAGIEGSLNKFAEEARSAVHDADVAGSSRAAREASDRATLAADDLRRSLPAIRETLALLRELSGHLDQQPESVIYGPRPANTKAK